MSIQKYKITKIKKLGSNVKVFCFEPLEGKLPEYKPGHFTFLHLFNENGESIVKRAYSIASSPDMPYIELCIKMVNGELTGRLERIEVGGVVGIEQPGGHLTYDDQPKIALIAGGTGISPMMSILRYITYKQMKGEFVLFYSARTRADILYREELEELQKKNENITVVITLTREEWEGEKGRLCHAVIGKYIDDTKGFNWWICGPMEMIKTMKQCLSSLGVEAKNIKIEGWG
ncbi:FAD-dependent oxidoreductase [Candidatus Micrarchaeota archaeon]|nr:FAD-dependent oxidoreductase [Candidatus Micrarchaeota archaeon]